MRVLNAIQRWKEHQGTKKCLKNRSSGLKTRSLVSLGFVKSILTPHFRVGGTIPSPCPGILHEIDPRIDRYLSRTSAAGGGVPSHYSIVKDLFKFEDSILWKDLNAQQQKMVLR
jgi:hypothetical protein